MKNMILGKILETFSIFEQYLKPQYIIIAKKMINNKRQEY